MKTDEMCKHSRTIRRISYLFAGCLPALLLPAVCAQTQLQYTISTFAGTPSGGFAGDGGAATSAQLFAPLGLAVDSAGNLFIADQQNHRIRKVTGGTISTVAGNGTNGNTGDAGPATSAEIPFPCCLAVDNSGNFYLGDPVDHIVRKVAGGTINKFAGTSGASGFAGDAAAATAAHLSSPSGVAVDSSGKVYIADSGNHRVRVVGTDGNISTFAGTGGAGDSGDGGTATNAALNKPFALAVDSAGNVYISDTGSHVVRKVTTNGVITTVAGNGTPGFSGDGGSALKASLNYPKAIAVDAHGNLYIADSVNSRIRVVAPNGIIRTIAGSLIGDAGDGGPATSAKLQFPAGIAVDSAGKVYVSDTGNNRVRVLTPVAGTAPAINGVLSASAFGAATSVAPGTWIEIYGTNLAGSTRTWTAADFKGAAAPVALSGTQVAIGGEVAFVSYISPTQVNVQVPSSVPAGQQQIIVTTAVGTSNPANINVSATQPGLFAPPSFTAGGKQYLGALFLDGKTYVMPTGAIQGIPSRPARPGETIVTYGVGFGPVTPSVDAGQISTRLNATAAPVQIFFGGTLAQTSYAGLAPGAVGLYQFNVIVPSIADSDAVPVTFKLGGVAGAQTLYTAVHN